MMTDDMDFIGMALGRAEYLEAEARILQRRVDNRGWIGGVTGKRVVLDDNIILRLKSRINDMLLEAQQLRELADAEHQVLVRKHEKRRTWEQRVDAQVPDAQFRSDVEFKGGKDES